MFISGYKNPRGPRLELEGPLIAAGQLKRGPPGGVLNTGGPPLALMETRSFFSGNKGWGLLGGPSEVPRWGPL